MSWQFFVTLSVLFFSVNGLLHKLLMREKNSNPYAQTIVFYGIVGFFALIISFLRGGFQYQITTEQLPYFILITIVASLASIFGFKAIQLIEASENSIILSSSRLWVVLGAFIILKEQFSLDALIGTLVIILGISIAQFRQKRFTINQGTIFSLITAFFYAITEITSFFILRDFDAASLTVYTCWLPVIALLIIKPKVYKKFSFYLKRKNAINITLVSLSDVFGTIFLFLAYQAGRNASQIGPIMATQTIIVVLLGIIFLKEKSNMIQKITGGLIAVTGTILLL